MFSIRRIEAKDSAFMAEIIQSVMTEYGAVGEGFSIKDPEVRDMYRAYAGERSAYFVLEQDGHVVGGAGVAALAGAGPETCELRKMYFLPEARGNGQGRRMLEFCLQVAREMGFRRCYLETMETMGEARALYLHSGFVPLPGPEGATGHFGCNAWYMRELGPPAKRRS